MFNIFKKRDNRNNIDGSEIKIKYENGIVKNEISSWIKEIGIININDFFIKLGFDKEDILYLYQDYSGLYRVLYSVNEDKIKYNNIIRFNHKNKELIVTNHDESRCYKIINKDNKNIKLELLYHKKRINDKITLFHRIENNSSIFVIDNGDYELTLEIYTDAKISKDEFKDLEIYLSSLIFPIEIDKVYSDICNILSLDQDIMEMLNLVVTKNIGSKKPDIVMDEILIENGVLEKITKTTDNISVTLDKNSNWSYSKIDDSRIFTVKYQEESSDKYRYVYHDNSKNKDGYFSKEDISLIKDSAIIEIDNMKKLVKQKFKK